MMKNASILFASAIALFSVAAAAAPAAPAAVAIIITSVKSRTPGSTPNCSSLAWPRTPQVIEQEREWCDAIWIDFQMVNNSSFWQLVAPACTAYGHDGRVIGQSHTEWFKWARAGQRFDAIEPRGTTKTWVRISGKVNDVARVDCQANAKEARTEQQAIEIQKGLGDKP
jgi:hypothetical protein